MMHIARAAAGAYWCGEGLGGAGRLVWIRFVWEASVLLAIKQLLGTKKMKARIRAQMMSYGSVPRSWVQIRMLRIDPPFFAIRIPLPRLEEPFKFGFVDQMRMMVEDLPVAHFHDPPRYRGGFGVMRNHHDGLT